MNNAKGFVDANVEKRRVFKYKKYDGRVDKERKGEAAV